MTMVPAQNLSKNQQQEQELQFDHFLRIGGYGGGGYCGGSYINTTTDCFGAAVMSRLEGSGGRGGGGGYDHYNCDTTDANCLSGSDHHHNNHNNLVDHSNPMAEDESRTNSLNNEAGAGGDGSSSREVEEEIKTEGGEWLQLSIGGRTTTSPKHDHDLVDPTTARRGGPLIELDLLPGGITTAHQGRPLSAPIFHVPPPPLHFTPPRPVATTNISVGPTNFSTTSLFFQHQYPAAAAAATGSSSYYNYGSEMNWALRPTIQNMASSSSPSPSTSSFSSSMMPLGYPSYNNYYSSRPNYNFQVHSSTSVGGGGGGGGGMDVAGPSLEFRVIDPPRRPHSGIWFRLQASQNQAKEPFLPQISKSYLRIKDGRMTVSLLMKYLVNKLRLDSESEIEIRCRGQQLQPFFTMQHVRDNIWSPTDHTLTATLLPDSSTTDDHHLMLLHYARTTPTPTPTPTPHQDKQKVTLL